jgi:hypothetical protein
LSRLLLFLKIEAFFNEVKRKLEEKVYYQDKVRPRVEVTMFISATEAKVQDGRQAQGQDKQGSKTSRARKIESGKRHDLTGQTLVSLTNKTNWQQTNREHRYKYTGDNGEDGRHLEGVGDEHKDR